MHNQSDLSIPKEVIAVQKEIFEKIQGAQNNYDSYID